MSDTNINTIGKLPLSEIANVEASVVIEWLKNQPDFVGEAIAKLCYQQLTALY